MLNALRLMRYFDLLVKVADVLIQTAQEAPNIRRQYAHSTLRRIIQYADSLLLQVQCKGDDRFEGLIVRQRCTQRQGQCLCITAPDRELRTRV